jgi:uncharacterized membrane protein
MPTEKTRYMYIDLLRGWAVLVMIETHVVNAFLIPAYRTEPWFAVLNFINGLVAPSFLFIAGYAFAVIGQRKWNDYISLGPAFRKQFRRIIQIWIVGYALHVPFFSLQRLITSEWSAWSPFWKVDVLHCIAVSLLVLLILVVVIRKPAVYFWIVLGASMIIVLATPVISTIHVDAYFPLPIAQYFNYMGGSQFPIFPWMAFVVFGACCGQYYALKKDGNAEKKIFSAAFLLGAGTIILMIVIRFIPIVIYPGHDYWKTSPEFFFIRLGIVLMLLSTLWYWEQNARSGRSPVSVVGMESLVAYSGHLLVIYGLFFQGRSLSFIIGKTLHIPEVAGMTVMFLLATIAISYGWNTIKNKDIRTARWVQYSILAIVIYIFITRPL